MERVYSCVSGIFFLLCCLLLTSLFSMWSIMIFSQMMVIKWTEIYFNGFAFSHSLFCVSLSCSLENNLFLSLATNLVRKFDVFENKFVYYLAWNRLYGMYYWCDLSKYFHPGPSSSSNWNLRYSNSSQPMLFKTPSNMYVHLSLQKKIHFFLFSQKCKLLAKAQLMLLIAFRWLACKMQNSSSFNNVFFFCFLVRSLAQFCSWCR